MSLSRKIPVFFGASVFAIAVWMLPLLSGADQFPGLEHRHEVGRLVADVWHVEEGVAGRAVWIGTWTRRGRSDVFNAVWRNMENGAEVRDQLRLIEARDRVIFHRNGTNGEYMGQLSPDGAHMEGTASWYSPGGFWRADAVSSRHW